MRHKRLDDRTADRLIAGRMTPEDAPAGFAGVAALLRDAHGVAVDPATAPPASETSTIAAMAATIVRQQATVRPSAARAAGRRSRRMTTKVAGLAAVATLLGVGTAAAATGSLPTPAQNAAADTLAKIGVSLPASAGHGNVKSHATTTDGDSATNTSTSKGPSSNADFGLCNAEAKSDGH